MRGLTIYRASKGTQKHNGKHRCNLENPETYGCPNAGQREAWATTDEEFIKFGARLMYQKEGNRKEALLLRYKRAWNNLYPGTVVPLTAKGEPIDFLWDVNYTCPDIPWMADIPPSESLTGKFSI